MTNKQIARYLKETAQLIELSGGNPFRARAFENAARTIERMDQSLLEWMEDHELTEIHGVGSGLALQIRELIDRGSFSLREELLSSIPAGLPEVLRVKGLGARKVRKLWKELEITTLDELEVAAAAGRLSELDGFGRKTQENIVASIQNLKKYLGRRRYAEVCALVNPAIRHLRSMDFFKTVEFTGELRRALETTSAPEIIASCSKIDGTLDAVREVFPLAEEISGIIPGDPAVYETFISGDLLLRIHVVPEDVFGTAQWKLTGSARHLESFTGTLGKPPASANEREIYQAAGIHYVPPELREGTDELEAAAAGRVPELIELSHLKGTIHNHTTYSDGVHSLAEMSEAAYESRFEYIGICDHSRSLTVANGLSIDRVAKQQSEIAELNRTWANFDRPFRIFRGIESDILADGSLDYPDDVLETFELVVASVHSRFSMSEDEMTRRIVRAVENPYTRVLGHPTGRLLLIREGYDVDLAKVIDACAANRVAIELNANPRRLDLDWRWIRHATERGILISINPDAHNIEELEYMHWGVAAARKGWLTPDQCLNALPLDAFEHWLTEDH